MKTEKQTIVNETILRTSGLLLDCCGKAGSREPFQRCLNWHQMSLGILTHDIALSRSPGRRSFDACCLGIGEISDQADCQLCQKYFQYG